MKYNDNKGDMISYKKFEKKVKGFFKNVHHVDVSLNQHLF